MERCSLKVTSSPRTSRRGASSGDTRSLAAAPDLRTACRLRTSHGWWRQAPRLPAFSAVKCCSTASPRSAQRARGTGSSRRRVAKLREPHPRPPTPHPLRYLLSPSIVPLTQADTSTPVARRGRKARSLQPIGDRPVAEAASCRPRNRTPCGLALRIPSRAPRHRGARRSGDLPCMNSCRPAPAPAPAPAPSLPSPMSWRGAPPHPPAGHDAGVLAITAILRPMANLSWHDAAPGLSAPPGRSRSASTSIRSTS